MEDTLYEIASMRLFAKLSLDQAIPDCTTIMMKQGSLVDAKSGLTHSLETTPANEHDFNQVGHLLHGEEAFVFADAGYQGLKTVMSWLMMKARSTCSNLP